MVEPDCIAEEVFKINVNVLQDEVSTTRSCFCCCFSCTAARRKVDPAHNHHHRANLHNQHLGVVSRSGYVGLGKLKHLGG